MIMLAEHISVIRYVCSLADIRGMKNHGQNCIKIKFQFQVHWIQLIVVIDTETVDELKAVNYRQEKPSVYHLHKLTSLN